MLRNIILILSIFTFAAIGEDDSTIVQISNGKIRGTFNGKYYSFKGIPYAAPPVGENRFESPKPYEEQWSDVRDATKHGATCLRLDPLIILNEIILEGSEDCLFVNVYTPKIKTDKLLPVVLYIHGGGFMFGSGDDLGEKFLMQEGNMIYVTFNYRLGPLGFMSTEDDQITGNMGLKDQKLLLKWVHENIKAFGGDKNEILIAGFSAGAASVELQLLQTGVENLVKAAYSMSGSSLCPWAMKRNVLQDVKKVAKFLQCPDTESTEEIKKCLKKASANDIVNSSKEFFIINYNPIVVWGPTIESPKSKDPMLLEAPEEIIKKGQSGRVPYLSSYVSEDGGFISAELLYQKPDGTTDLEYFNKNYKELLPKVLFYEDRFTNTAEVDKYTEELYANTGITDGTVTIENFDKLTKIATDEVMTHCVESSWKLHKQYSPSAIYSYKYNYPATLGIANFKANRTDINFGCAHGDDVLLMFNFPARVAEKFNEAEKRHSKNFLKLLETFVTTGTPKFGDVSLPDNSNSSEDVEYLNIFESETKVEKV